MQKYAKMAVGCGLARNLYTCICLVNASPLFSVYTEDKKLK